MLVTITNRGHSPPETNVQSPPPLARSASVREPPKTSHGPLPVVGGLNHQAGDISQGSPSDKSKASRDTKRRTVQVEYVAPQSQTARGGGDLQELSESQTREAVVEESQPPAPPAKDYPVRATAKPQASYDKPLPGHFPRSTSDTAAFTGTHTTAPAGHSSARPTTGASMASFHTGRLPSRGSYGQPVAPTVTATNTEGRLAQPKSGQFTLGQNPAPPSASSIGRPSTQQLPPAFNPTPRQEPPKGHKRSNTVSSLGEKLFGRSGSILGSRNSPSNANPRSDRQNRRYPPTSMRDPLPREDSRTSMDSRRSMQYAHGRKASQAGDGRARRFSLLPSSFSFRTFSSGRDQTPEEVSQTPRTAEPMGSRRSPVNVSQPRPQATSYEAEDVRGAASEGPVEPHFDHQDPQPVSYEAQIDQQFAELGNRFDQPQGTFGAISTEPSYNNNDEYSNRNYTYSSKPTYYDDYNNGNNTYDNVPRQSMQTGRRGPNVLQKSHRKFADAYEYERDGSHHSGSSGPARKVMDFFRRRAKSRAGE